VTDAENQETGTLGRSPAGKTPQPTDVELEFWRLAGEILGPVDYCAFSNMMARRVGR